jgi:hypothetical protein
VLRLQREANAVTLAPDGRRAAVGLQVPQKRPTEQSCHIWSLQSLLLWQHQIFAFIWIVLAGFRHELFLTKSSNLPCRVEGKQSCRHAVA